MIDLETGAKSSIEELLEHTCRLINEAHNRYTVMCDKLDDSYRNDFFRRDFERGVARARFVLETADLERQRMWLIQELAVSPTHIQVVRIDGA